MDLKYGKYEFRVDAQRPLFVAISGSHSYGIARPNSDLDVRAVRIPTLDWALALSRNESGVQRIHKSGVDIVEHTLYHFLSVLLHGNATFLENLFQEHVYEDPVFPELKELIMKHGISKRFAGHYYGFIRSSLRDYAKSKKIKNLLYAYRIYLAGIRLFETGEVLYSFYDLLPSASDRAQSIIQGLLDLYKTEGDLIMPGHILACNATQQLSAYLRHFGDYESYKTEKKRRFVYSETVSSGKLPDVPSYDPFNKWLKKLLLKDKITYVPSYPHPLI